jgi:hypothetical protein
MSSPAILPSLTVTVSVTPASGPSDFDEIKVVDHLSQSIMNNYFSIGSDAFTALRVRDCSVYVSVCLYVCDCFCVSV